jgi:FixJ family two-component response regulator
MPGMSGRQLSLSLSVRLPFYLVTGDVSLTLQSLKEDRILNILYKPINFDEIRSIIATHLFSEDS